MRAETIQRKSDGNGMGKVWVLVIEFQCHVLCSIDGSNDEAGTMAIGVRAVL